MKQKTIGIFTGSSRRKSYSGQVAKLAAQRLETEFEVRYIAIDQLPLFNQDYDDLNETPPEWIAFREQTAKLDGFLFVTPEYNRSYPPLLKNALDIASRPYGENLWGGKPGVIISVSPGRLGGFGANHHLRQVMMFLDIRIMSQPEIYIGNVDRMLTEDGSAVNEKSAAYFDKIAEAVSAWMKNE